MAMLIAVAVTFVLLVSPMTLAHLVFFIRNENVYLITEPKFVIFRHVKDFFVPRAVLKLVSLRFSCVKKQSFI